MPHYSSVFRRASITVARMNTAMGTSRSIYSFFCLTRALNARVALPGSRSASAIPVKNGINGGEENCPAPFS